MARNNNNKRLQDIVEDIFPKRYGKRSKKTKTLENKDC